MCWYQDRCTLVNVEHEKVVLHRMSDVSIRDIIKDKEMKHYDVINHMEWMDVKIKITHFNYRTNVNGQKIRHGYTASPGDAVVMWDTYTLKPPTGIPTLRMWRGYGDKVTIHTPVCCWASLPTHLGRDLIIFSPSLVGYRKYSHTNQPVNHWPVGDKSFRQPWFTVRATIGEPRPAACAPNAKDERKNLPSPPVPGKKGLGLTNLNQIEDSARDSMLKNIDKGHLLIWINTCLFITTETCKENCRRYCILRRRTTSELYYFTHGQTRSLFLSASI